MSYTLLIPHYTNQTNFLKQNLESIDSWGARPEKVIVFNITDTKPHVGDHVLLNGKANHQYDMINQVLDQVGTKYLFVLDSQNSYYNTKIEDSIDRMNSLPNIFMVYSDFDVLALGKMTRIFQPPYDFRILANSLYFNTNNMFNVELIKELGGFDVNNPHQSMIKIVQKSMMLHIPKSLFLERKL